MTNHDSSKATPRPWRAIDESRISPKGEVSIAYYLEGLYATHVASLDCGEFRGDQKRGQETAHANAALIVAAVNAYDKARELAEFVLVVCSPNAKGTEKELHDKAREVLEIMGG